MNKREWFRMENAGKLYGSVISERTTTFYRFSVTLKSPVDVSILTVALELTFKRFPYFNVIRKKGFFWNYFEKNSMVRVVEQEKFYPCTHSDDEQYPLNVFYFNSRISLEIMHGLTDGYGATTFLKKLMEVYAALLLNFEYYSNYYTTLFEAEIDELEVEDGFINNHIRRFHLPSQKARKAMHLPFKKNKKGVYYVTTGYIDVKTVKSEAKKYGATISEYLLALYFETLFDYIKKQPYLKRKLLTKKPVSLNVPVDLRSFYPSKTMWNFFITIIPTIETKYGYYEFDEIIDYVKYFFKSKIHKRFLNSEIKQVIAHSNNIFNRLIPLMLKDMILPILYSRIGEGTYTSGFSNLGLMKFDEEADKLIETLEFYPPPSDLNKIKVGVIAVKDKIAITFGSLCHDTEIEKMYFRKLVAQGIPVKIESNRG